MAGPGAKPDPAAQPKLRLDKWLFQARFFKGRDLAAEVITAGHLRLNGQHCLKPGHAVLPALRRDWEGADDEELEYAAQNRAAAGSLVRIGAKGDAGADGFLLRLRRLAA